MLCRLFLLAVFWVPLFGATSSAAAALGATGQILYPVDAGNRGTQIVNAFAFFSSAIATTSTYPYVALQTNLPTSLYYNYTTYKNISNGIISYVQNIFSTTYNTLLIVKYLPPSGSRQTLPQYVVVPAEQIVELLYFTVKTLPASNAPFTSSPINGTIPFFSVDPTQRAVDIVYAVNQLMTTFKNTGTNSQVWVQITLKGPFKPPLPNPGLLQNIQSVTYSNSLIQFTFQTTNQPIVQTVLVAPEQVQQITYLQTFNSP